MSPLLIAGILAGAGVVMEPASAGLHLPRLGAAVPLLGAVLVLFAAPAGVAAVPLGGLTGLSGIDRVAQGMLVIGGVSLGVLALLQPQPRRADARTAGLVGAMAIVCLAGDGALVTALALMVAIAVLALHWIVHAPARVTLAAGRVAGAGAGALLAAAPFLPLTGTTSSQRAVLVGTLLAVAVAALLALYPLGGWATAAFASLRGVEVAPWLLLLAPAVLLLAERIPSGALGDGIEVYEHTLLVMGLGSAVWGGIQAVRGPERTRYGRVFMTDIALALAAVSSAQGGAALFGGLVLVMTHVTLAPILLRNPQSGGARPRRAAWALLSGVPPTPSFWGRFLVLEALAQGTTVALPAALVAMAAVFVAAVLTCAGPLPQTVSTVGRRLAADAVPWVLVGVAIAIGLAPQSLTTFVFGGS